MAEDQQTWKGLQEEKIGIEIEKRETVLREEMKV